MCSATGTQNIKGSDSMERNTAPRRREGGRGTAAVVSAGLEGGIGGERFGLGEEEGITEGLNGGSFYTQTTNCSSVLKTVEGDRTEPGLSTALC